MERNGKCSLCSCWFWLCSALQAVVCGRQPSRWLRGFLAGRRSVTGVYLEDFGQVDQVHTHLIQVYRSAPCLLPCLAQADEIWLFTDVLLPEVSVQSALREACS